MGPIELLMSEHRLIERAIDALFGYTGTLEAGEASTKAELGAFVAFIAGFADTHHHGKEEDILFRAMTDHGMPADAGPLAVMLHEHEEGRGYVKLMAEAAQGEGELVEADRSQVIWAAKSYGNLLRAHIQKEDQVLYPMADQMLPEPAWRDIEKAFDAFEAEDANRARATELRASVESLIAKYAPTAD